MYGYRIDRGKPVIDPCQAECLKELFRCYISGMSLSKAARKSKVCENPNHCSVKKMLMNRHYLGDEHYPQIISEDVFGQAQEELQRRGALRKRKPEAPMPSPQPSRFIMRKPALSYEDPATQAEYLYSLIESEE